MIEYNKNTPVLFLLFNRPDTTQLVFEAIRKAKPNKLYIAADGPRTFEENGMCNETRNIATANIDWDCSVFTLFREKNLGCRYAVSSAITWFFENESEGIILEDDCLPSDSFFGFCSSLLEKYRNDDRIGHIGGVNFQFDNIRGDGSYYFSKLPHIWGWASWRRVWKDYDVTMKSFPEFKANKHLDNIEPHIYKNYWIDIFETTYNGELNTWDTQYTYQHLINNRLAVLPNINLISNIGFGINATHTIHYGILANIPNKNIEEIKHPKFLLPDLSADLFTQKIQFQIEEPQQKNIFSRTWKKIKGLVKNS